MVDFFCLQTFAMAFSMKQTVFIGKLEYHIETTVCDEALTHIGNKHLGSVPNSSYFEYANLGSILRATHAIAEITQSPGQLHFWADLPFIIGKTWTKKLFLCTNRVHMVARVMQKYNGNCISADLVTAFPVRHSGGLLTSGYRCCNRIHVKLVDGSETYSLELDHPSVDLTPSQGHNIVYSKL